MSRLVASQRAWLAPAWVREDLSRKAQALPSLDLRFAESKSLIDAASGQSLVTFTRASSGTYVGSDGLLKTATTNLLLRSEEFDNASWVLFGTATRSANATTAPNGTQTGDSVTLPVASGIYQIINGLPSVTYTLSIWVRADSSQSVRLVINTNLSDPVGNTINVSTTWQRYSITKTTSVGTTSVTAQLDTGGGNTFYLWGAQLEQSATVSEYIPTTSTINSAPRFDHNPTTGESLGLLVEEQRTNLALRSEQFDDAAWNSTAGARTVTANQITAPDGTTTADLVTADGTNAIHFVSQSFTLSAIPYSLSVFAKAGTESTVILRTFNALGNVNATFNLNTGTVVSNSAGTTAQIVAYPNNWYRCILNFTPVAATGGIGIYLSNVTAITISTTLYLWGAQLEAGAFPTSYIPTTTAAATRSADVASITGTNFSSWYRQDEGTVFADVNSAPVNNVAQLAYDISEGVGNERMFQRRSGSGMVSTAVIDNGVTQADIGGVAISASARYRSGFAYKLNDIELVVNGGGSVTDTSATLPTLDRIHIGQNYASGQSCNGALRRLTFWPARLPNSTIQALTQ